MCHRHLRLLSIVVIALTIAQLFAGSLSLAQEEPTVTGAPPVAAETVSPVPETPSPEATAEPTAEPTADSTAASPTVTPDPVETATAAPATPAATATAPPAVAAGPTPTPTVTPAAAPTASAAPPEGVVAAATVVAPRLTVSKNAGNVGNTLGVAISGFPAATRVAISFDGTRKVTLTTNSAGAASGSFKVPPAVAGLHELRASGGGVAATARFRIRPVLKIAPATVAAGRPVTVTLTGFAANASTRIRLYDVNGSATVLSVWVTTTDATGGRVQAYTTKKTLTEGTHRVVATDAALNADDALLTTTPPRPKPPVPSDPDVSQVYDHGTSGRKEIALTFDAGSDRGYTTAILDTLAAYGVRATFSVTGVWVQENPDLVRRMVREGHQVINHTWDHPSFTGESISAPLALSTDARVDQLERTEAIVASVTGGYQIAPYWRPPFGDIDASVLSDAAAAGYSATIMWSCDTLGWDGLSAAQILARCAYDAQAGDIILMHVGSDSQDGVALPDMIESLRADGFKLVTIEELLQR